MDDIVSRLNVSKLGARFENGHVSDLVRLNVLHVHHVPVLDGARGVDCSGCTRHHNGVVWFGVLDEAIQLQLVEHSDRPLRVLRLRAEANHHTHHLLIDVLTWLVLLHTLVVDFPASCEVFLFCIAVDEHRVADNIWHHAHLVSHISQ